MAKSLSFLRSGSNGEMEYWSVVIIYSAFTHYSSAPILHHSKIKFAGIPPGALVFFGVINLNNFIYPVC